jgi:hypothetical protein
MNIAIFEPGTASNPLDFFTNPYAPPGAFNPYFNLCGTDDPKASLGTTATAPPDMALIVVTRALPVYISSIAPESPESIIHHNIDHRQHRQGKH